MFVVLTSAKVEFFAQIFLPLSILPTHMCNIVISSKDVISDFSELRIKE